MRNDTLRLHSGRIAAILAIAALTTGIPAASWQVLTSDAPAATGPKAPVPVEETPMATRRRLDMAAMQAYRPSFAFWRQVFTLPDGSIAFGSAVDGRLLAIFPAKGNWMRDAVWGDPSVAHVLDGERLPRALSDRRERVALLLERATGPVLHNATRGDALRVNVDRYGPFVAEWGAIYERFGVPADIGLGQVILESGLSGTRRSEANAIGFCQWLRKNWARLNHFSATLIEGQNQTTQAPYCAAYLTVLATKYGSFIPALSEHNAGGTNVGRTLINGELLGAEDVRDRYFLGSKLARELRDLSGREYRKVYQSYGLRSHLYAEMVFGNTFIVRSLMASVPQEAIHAMRTPRAVSLAEIVRRTGLTADEVRRFNPALKAQVPSSATLYLPTHVDEFGVDVAFWREPPSTAYEAVLNEFMRLEPDPERWDDPAYAPVLIGFQRRFRDTGTEEGQVMDTVLAYAMDQAYTSRRRALLAEFRESGQVRQLIDRGVVELGLQRGQGR
jgi:hypothetical protein